MSEFRALSDFLCVSVSVVVPMSVSACVSVHVSVWVSVYVLVSVCVRVRILVYVYVCVRETAVTMCASPTASSIIPQVNHRSIAGRRVVGTRVFVLQPRQRPGLWCKQEEHCQGVGEEGECTRREQRQCRCA